MFEKYLKKWSLVQDGEPIETATSNLLPVQAPVGPAMLKLPKPAGLDEKTEITLRCYDGVGAVKILEADGVVTLMERIGPTDLKSLSLSGQDQQATRIIAETVGKMHQYSGPLPDLPNLSEIFAPLLTSTETRFALSATCAREMLNNRAQTLLHGDIHHENIMNSPRGWLAIDPKGMIGPAVYDFANSFHNPIPHSEIVRDVDRMHQMAAVFAANSPHSKTDLISAAVAHAGIATIWFEQDGGNSTYMLKNADILSTLI